MKIEKCPFCDKAVAEITNCKDLEGCRHFEKCPATEPYVCVVCNMFEGGCGASSGYYDSVEKAIAAWNRRVKPENKPLTCEGCQDEPHDKDGRYLLGKDNTCYGCRRNPNTKDAYRRKPEED